jgi:hypothetical protein
MKTTLHRIALRMGWYRNITTGLPLNVCKTVFGAFFMEGCYTPEPLSKLLEDVYRWGLHEGRLEGGPENIALSVDRVIYANRNQMLSDKQTNLLMEEFEEVPF